MLTEIQEAFKKASPQNGSNSECLSYKKRNKNTQTIIMMTITLEERERESKRCRNTKWVVWEKISGFRIE